MSLISSEAQPRWIMASTCALICLCACLASVCTQKQNFSPSEGAFGSRNGDTLLSTLCHTDTLLLWMRINENFFFFSYICTFLVWLCIHVYIFFFFLWDRAYPLKWEESVTESRQYWDLCDSFPLNRSPSEIPLHLCVRNTLCMLVCPHLHQPEYASVWIRPVYCICE